MDVAEAEHDKQERRGIVNAHAEEGTDQIGKGRRQRCQRQVIQTRPSFHRPPVYADTAGDIEQRGGNAVKERVLYKFIMGAGCGHVASQIIQIDSFKANPHERILSDDVQTARPDLPASGAGESRFFRAGLRDDQSRLPGQGLQVPETFGIAEERRGEKGKREDSQRNQGTALELPIPDAVSRH